MSDWRNVKLGDHVSLRGGFGFPERFQGGRDLEIPFYKVSDMSLNGNERHLGQSNNSVSRCLAGSQGWRTIPPGSVAFAKVGAALLLNRRRILKWESLVDNNMMAAVAGEEVDSKWLYWWLQLVDFAVFVQPGALPSVNQRQLSALNLSLPPLPEQQLIASILDTVDEVIRKTEEVIAKLQQMKQGLLHDLLTRGIDDNGELRDPDRHPEQFKDSPLGRIPKDWEVEALGTCLDHVIDYRGRTPLKIGMRWGGGDVPALSAKNVRMGKVDLSLETHFGSDLLYERWMTNGHVRRGDVLITMEAPLGNIAQVPDGQRYILSQRVVLLRFQESRALNDFLAVQMRASRFQENLRRWSTGTTATGIQRAKLVKIPVVLPRLEEQKSAISRVSSVETRVAAEQAELAKLRLLKSGLMDDLLTGRVRVTDLLP